MKALKNDCAAYVEQIGHAVTECYAVNAEPSNDELMRLYSVIGKCICAQGEKAFVVHLAEILAIQFPTSKGFSPRNLRRMRDFYRTYDSRPDLMHKAQALGWTQNAIILECCENNGQREFYIDLAIDRNLSKLSLMREIETEVYEQVRRQQDDMDQSTGEMSAPVSDASGNPGIDKTPAINAACGPFVTACGPPHQGDGMPYHTKARNLDIARRNCAVKDKNEKSTIEQIGMIRFFKTERVLSLIYSWLRRVDYTLTYERFRIGVWIGGSPPGRWRYPWKAANRILHTT